MKLSRHEVFQLLACSLALAIVSSFGSAILAPATTTWQFRHSLQSDIRAIDPKTNTHWSGYRAHGMEGYTLTFPGAAELERLRTDGKHPAIVERPLPPWMRGGYNSSAPVFVLGSGWPVSMLRMVWGQPGTTPRFTKLPLGAALYHEPILSGLLLNLTTHATIWVALLLLLRASQHAFRTRRRQCHQCTFDLNGVRGHHCPECGTPIPFSALPTAQVADHVLSEQVRLAIHDKPALRALLRAANPARTGEAGRESDDSIVASVLSLKSWPTASTVMLFAPLPGEPDIQPLISSATNKRICLPRLNSSTHSMDPVTITSWETDLRPSPIGKSLLEPRPDLPIVPLAHLDIVLVPALAFDLQGNRLGRGGGYYDRFLARLPSRVLRVGICLDRLVVERLPTDAHDQPVDIILTESRVIQCPKRS